MLQSRKRRFRLLEGNNIFKIIFENQNNLLQKSCDKRSFANKVLLCSFFFSTEISPLAEGEDQKINLRTNRVTIVPVKWFNTHVKMTYALSILTKLDTVPSYSKT